MTEVQVPYARMEMLPPGIEIVGMEEMLRSRRKSTITMQTWLKFLTTLCLVLCLRTLVQRLMRIKSSREEWEETISKGLTLLGINYEERSEPFPWFVWCNASVVE